MKRDALGEVNVFLNVTVRSMVSFLLVLSIGCAPTFARAPVSGVKPGNRSVMDAHNCYPYDEWWYDRITRALSAGTPLAIEQDLDWYTEPRTGKSWSVVAHGGLLTGNEPTMEHYFFDRISPIVERALRQGNRGDWPIITLNLDFKSEQPQLLEAVWNLLEKYRNWLTTAKREADDAVVQPLDVRPVLVLTGESDAQEKIFYDRVPVGDRLLVFGAVHTHLQDPMAPPQVLEPGRETNYRRWWNNPWNVVERGGQTKAGTWSAADDERLRSLVDRAHLQGLWIRFYTLDGAPATELSCRGWFRSYDFGSLAAARTRWRAAFDAGVDYIATDQYEQLGAYLRQLRRAPARRARNVH